MLGRKNSSHFINNKFTSNLKFFTLLLMMRKITLVVKFDEKYVHCSIYKLLCQCKCGALVENQVGDPEVPGLSLACVDKLVFCRHGMSNVRLGLSVFLGGVKSYLPNGWSVNLRVIEN
jgi:hypothetical protein